MKKGARVEIKGVQNLDLMSEIVENEVQRQLALIEIKEELNKKNAQLHLKRFMIWTAYLKILNPKYYLKQNL